MSKPLLGFLAWVALFCSAPVANAAGADGRWRLATSLPQFGVTYNLECVLEQRGGELRGSCTDGGGKDLPLEGSVDGQKIEFHYDTDMAGVTCRMKYVGHLSGDGGLGTVSAGELVGTFTARKL